MSLRPVDRSSKSGHVRTRSRSRDDRPSAPVEVKSSKSKTKKKARFGEEDDEDDNDRSIPGAFEPEAPTKYEVRGPKNSSKASPGLSALAAGLPPRRDDSDEAETYGNDWRRRKDASDSDDYVADRAHTKRGSRSYDHEPPKPKGGIMSTISSFMPSFPSMPEDDDDYMPISPPRSRHASSAGPAYPQYPDDDRGPMAMMPSANYSTLHSHAYEPSSPSALDHAPPTARPRPKHAESYSTFEPPRNPAALPRSTSYTASTETRQPQGVETQVDEKRGTRHRLSISDPRNDVRVASSGGLLPSMNRLSVAGGHAPMGSKGLPPASPLLEAYKGTYQSISPMPSPMMLAKNASESDDDIPELPSLSGKKASAKISKSARFGGVDDKTSDDDVVALPSKSAKRRVVIYDSEADAKEIWTALDHLRHIDAEPLIKILPGLTHDQLLELRETYKKTYKKGGEKVDLAKHIKLQTEGNFGKICFVTASGRWKSEAYWASFWYQSHATGRELLVEALTGRTNAEIREITKAFRDRRYDDDLARCMRKELKPDKFREALLAVLEEQRQEETDAWSMEARNVDVQTLRQAVTGLQGGESAILAVVVSRSDKHLAQVLETYKRLHGTQFARDALKKSQNLVVSLDFDPSLRRVKRLIPIQGEVIIHICNGAVNRPARDAALLHHAIEDIREKNKEAALRFELLMSRLVRFHWDRTHMIKVKSEYQKKNGKTLEEDLGKATKGDFGRFCLGLCET